MARVLGLIALLYSVLLSGVAAAVTPVTKYRIVAPQYNFDSGYVGSASSACNSLAGVVGTTAGISTIGDVGGAFCTVWPFNRFSPYGSWSIGEAMSCPDGSSGSGGSCACNEGYTETEGACKKPPSCPAGQHEQGGACVPDDCKADEVRVNGLCVKEPPCPDGQERVNGVCRPKKCKAGASAGSWHGFDNDTAQFMCDSSNNCLVQVNPNICVSWDGKKECTGPGTYTGATCSGGSGTGPGTAPGTGGSDTGGTGGTGTGGTGTGGTGTGGTGTGGTGTGGTGTGGTGTGGTGTGGTGTGGTGTAPGGGSGPPAVQGPGKIPDGDTGGSGSGSGVGLPPPVTTPPDAAGQCPEGQKLSSDKLSCIQASRPPDGDGKCPAGMVKAGNMCHSTEPVGGGSGNGVGDGKNGMFTGACMAGFACEGDAIQCAIAKEQHRRSCQLMENESPESKLYNEEKGKEGNRTKELDGNETIDLNNRISSADLLGGGQGMQDLVVTVMGSSVTLPFSRINTYLSALGNVLLAVSFLIAVRIVGRG